MMWVNEQKAWKELNDKILAMQIKLNKLEKELVKIKK
jgi:hypothetical protein